MNTKGLIICTVINVLAVCAGAYFSHEIRRVQNEARKEDDQLRKEVIEASEQLVKTQQDCEKQNAYYLERIREIRQIADKNQVEAKELHQELLTVDKRQADLMRRQEEVRDSFEYNKQGERFAGELWERMSDLSVEDQVVLVHGMFPILQEWIKKYAQKHDPKIWENIERRFKEIEQERLKKHPNRPQENTRGHSPA